MEKKIPMRRCVGCGESRDKKLLVRVVRTPEGKITVDLTGKASGRGAYLCRNPECLRKAARKKMLNRAFKEPVAPDIYEQLEKELTQ